MRKQPRTGLSGTFHDKGLGNGGPRIQFRKGIPMPSYLPSREADLVTWSNNFNTLINVDPVAYGLDIGQAAAYTALHDAFVSAFQTANDNSTRTPSAVVTKNDAKEALIEGPGGIRELVTIIQGNPTTTDTQRSDLEITIRDTEPTPVPVPGNPPEIDVIEVYGRKVTLRLRDVKNPTKRGKPDGVIGATILSFIGETPPTSAGAWQLEGSTGRTTYTVEFPETVAPGTKVWLTAFWYNPRSQSGPAATPIHSHIGYEGLAQAA